MTLVEGIFVQTNVNNLSSGNSWSQSTTEPASAETSGAFSVLRYCKDTFAYSWLQLQIAICCSPSLSLSLSKNTNVLNLCFMIVMSCYSSTIVGSVPSRLLSAHQPTVPLLPKWSPAGPSHVLPSIFWGAFQWAPWWQWSWGKSAHWRLPELHTSTRKFKPDFPLWLQCSEKYHTVTIICTCQKVPLFMPLKSFLGSKVVVLDGTLRSPIVVPKQLSQFMHFVRHFGA